MATAAAAAPTTCDVTSPPPEAAAPPVNVQDIPTPPEPAVAAPQSGSQEATQGADCKPKATKSRIKAGTLASAENGRECSPQLSEGSIEEVNALLAETAIGAASKPAKDASTRQKRNENKGIEHVLKALNSLESTEEKLAALCTKYTELLEEHRLTQNKHKQNQKKLTSLSREKDHLQNEQSKAVLAKSKLESLCRELQRHNKLIKDESLARAKEEEEKRKEVTSKFQATINDIQSQMNENYEKNNLLREENVELATKLKNLIEQYELREKHIEKVFRHKELENQLVDAKLAQSNLQMTEEKERNLREKQSLVELVDHSQEKIKLLQAQEHQLRQQVALYTEKYDEFQTTLSKSNDVFQSLKSEMDKMTKKIKKLEKETTMWRSRWENSNKALIEMAEEKTRSDKDILQLNSKVQKLESLCRALQEERKKLSGKAKATVPDNSLKSDVAVESDPKAEALKVIEVTKTPPNTPEGARASPEPDEDTTKGDDRDTEKASEDNSSSSVDSTEAADQTTNSVLQAESVSDQLQAVLDQQADTDQPEVTETPADKQNSQSEDDGDVSIVD